MRVKNLEITWRRPSTTPTQDGNPVANPTLAQRASAWAPLRIQRAGPPPRTARPTATPTPTPVPTPDTGTAFNFDLAGTFTRAQQAGEATVQQLVAQEQPSAEARQTQADAHQKAISQRTAFRLAKSNDLGIRNITLPPLFRQDPDEAVMSQVKAGKLNTMSIAQRSLALDVGMMIRPQELAAALAATPPDAATTSALTAWCTSRMDALMGTLPDAPAERRDALATIVGRAMVADPDAMVRALDGALGGADAALQRTLLGDFAGRVLEQIPDASLPRVLSSVGRHASDAMVAAMETHSAGLLERLEARTGAVAGTAFKRMSTASAAGLRKDAPMPGPAQLAALIADRPVMTQRTALVAWMASLGEEKKSADPAKLDALQGMEKTARNLFLGNKGTPGVTKQMFVEMQKTCDTHGLGGLAQLAGACAAKLPKSEVMRQWLGVTSATLAAKPDAALATTLNQMREETATLRNTHFGVAKGEGLINESVQHFHAASKLKAPELQDLVVLANELKTRPPTLEGSMTQWLKTIEHVKGGITPGRSDLHGQLSEIENAAKGLQKRHLDYGEKATALLKTHAERLSNDHPDAPITRIAKKLSNEISPEDLGRPIDDFHAVLHNSHFGRVFENQLVHAMLNDPPATVQTAMKQFGAAYAELMQSEAWQKGGNFERLLGNLQPLITADRYWCMNAPGLAPFRAATTIDDAKKTFMEFLAADKNSGADCAALLYLAHRISEYTGEGDRAPWFKANMTHYDELISLHKSRLEIEIAKDARATPAEGIGLLHQPGIDIREPWSFMGANPATGYKPNLARGKTSAAVSNSLQREVPYVAGASGVMSSITHIVDHFNKNMGHHIDMGAAALGTAMFLNTSHSFNEVLFSLARLNEPLGLGLELGKGDTKQFVADYQQLLPRLAGADGAHVTALMDKALDATVAEFRKTGPAMLLNEAGG